MQANLQKSSRPYEGIRQETTSQTHLLSVQIDLTQEAKKKPKFFATR